MKISSFGRRNLRLKVDFFKAFKIFWELGFEEQLKEISTEQALENLLNAAMEKLLDGPVFEPIEGYEAVQNHYVPVSPERPPYPM